MLLEMDSLNSLGIGRFSRSSTNVPKEITNVTFSHNLATSVEANPSHVGVQETPPS